MPPRVLPKPKSSEHTGELCDLSIGVRGDVLTLSIDLAGAVGVELPQSDREQLHDLARVVLVWVAIDGRICLLVAYMTEISAHAGMHRHLHQDVEVVAKSVADKDVIVIGHAEHLILQVGIATRGNEDLTECKGDTLTELVLSADGCACESGTDVVAKEEGSCRLRSCSSGRPGVQKGLL